MYKCVRTTNQEGNVIYTEIYNSFNERHRDEYGFTTYQHPMTFSLMLEDNTPQYHQAMNGPESDGFFEPMHKEMETIKTMDPWEVVPRTEAE